MWTLLTFENALSAAATVAAVEFLTSDTFARNATALNLGSPSLLLG